MSRQNRATPPQIKVSHLSPDPPVALSSRSQQAGGAAGWWRVSRHFSVPKTDRATRGIAATVTPVALLCAVVGAASREWPRYCRKVYWTKMVQNGPNGHFGQNDLIPNWILAFARPKWTKMVHFGPFWPEEVHFGPFRSANRTLAIPELGRDMRMLISEAEVLGSPNFLCTSFLGAIPLKRGDMSSRPRKIS